jgi:hypothetical protein
MVNLKNVRGGVVVKKLICAIVLCLAWTQIHAVETDIIWAGGGLKVSDESNPCYYADTFVWLTQLGTMSLFSQPMITVKGGDPGFDLGIGGRQPMMNGMILGGGNIFFDYTTNNDHKRFGAGLEIYHSRFSTHLNMYLPISGSNDGQEALSGFDLTFGIPLPGAAFVSLWPGMYHYAGKDRGSMGGMSMTVQVQPIKPLYISAGGRNDTLQSGKDKNELFVKCDIVIPLARLGKDIFAFNKGDYPLDVKASMDHRVIREDFITYENKKK